MRVARSGTMATDPLWVSIPSVAQTILTGIVAAAAGAYGYYRFIHRRVRTPKLDIDIVGTVVGDERCRYVVFDVVVANVGDTMLTIVPTFVDATAAPLRTGAQFSGIQVFALSRAEISRIATSDAALVWNYNRWQYSEALRGQWLEPHIDREVLGPSRRTNYPFLVPLPYRADAVFVSVYVGVRRGDRDSSASTPDALGIVAEKILRYSHSGMKDDEAPR